MNRLILVAALFLIHTSSFAQKNFFIQPYIGAGTSGIFDRPISSVQYKNVTAYTGGVNIGMLFSRLSVNTGVSLLTRGSKLEGLIFERGYDPATGTAIPDSMVDITYDHRHILIPATVGFAVLKNDRFSITPRAGIDLAFNIGSYSTWKYHVDGHKTKTKLNGPGNPYSTVSLLGHISIMFAYHLNSHIALTAEPVFYQQAPSARGGVNNHNYAITGNLGLLLNL